MLLTGKQDDTNILGERSDLDFFKEKLQHNINSGIPLEHPSNDKLRSQIALLEDVRGVHSYIVDVGELPQDKARQMMEQLTQQVKNRGQLNG